jgi:sugar phosphate permease
MAVITFVFFLIFERRGIVKYPQRVNKEKGEKTENPVRVLLRHGIVKFSIISILTGIIRTSVVFWLPTYFYQYLGFSEEKSATIFTVVTLIISPTAFIAIFLYEKVMKKSMHVSVLVYFTLAAVCFALLFVTKQPILNICLICLGIMASNSATSVLWSIYCPSLSETGLVSSATGFLDFLSYMAAAFANIVFPNAVSVIGWDGLILVWLALMVVGVVICLPLNKIFKRKEAK